MPVSNSSPLIHLARLGKLGYAKRVFPSMMIPPAVRLETVERGKQDGYQDALLLEQLAEEGWLRTTALSSASENLATALSDVVGRGEAEAIALAAEKEERLLIDDLKGRRTAQLYNVRTTTTLGLILEFLVEGALTRIDYVRNVKTYSSQGWITGDVLEEFLQRGSDIE